MGGHHSCVGSAWVDLGGADLPGDAPRKYGPFTRPRVLVGRHDVAGLGAPDSRNSLARAPLLADRRRLEVESSGSCARVSVDIDHSQRCYHSDQYNHAAFR